MNPTQVILMLAAASMSDQRTVKAWLAGRPVRGVLLNERIDRAAKELGVRPATAGAR